MEIGDQILVRDSFGGKTFHEKRLLSLDGLSLTWPYSSTHITGI
jgi:hypothetical protein